MKKYVILVLFLIVPISGYSQSPTPLAIDEIPSSNLIRQKHDVHIGEYEGSGIIEDVHSDYVVIADRALPFANNMKKVNLKGKSTSTQLVKGMFVYYFYNKNRQLSKIVIEE